MTRLTTDQKLECIKIGLDKLEEHITDLEAEIEKLEGQDMFFAREWWKDGKYLYLVFPQEANGNRKRVYVGSNKVNVARARAKVTRWERHRDLHSKLNASRNALYDHNATLGLLADRLKRLIGDRWPSVASN